MTTITKERIELFIKNPLENGLTRGEQMELARIALASLEADPVKRVNSDQMRRVCLEANRHLDKYDAMAKEVNKLLGRIAPPAPVVPEEATPENVEMLSGYVSTYKLTDSERDIATEIWNACRAAMLQSGNFRENKNSSTNNFREIAETSTNYPAIPSEVLSAILKVARIRADFDDFDGDRRGIGDCLDEAEQELIVTINKYASQLAAEPIATNDVREQQTAVPPVPEIQDDVAQAIENLKQKLVECNRYNYCADAVKGVEDACHAAMLQGSQPVSQTYKLPVNTPCQDAPAHIWLQTAGVWPEDGELSELTWCSHNQHHDDTLYVRADLVNGNSPVTPDGWISCSERMPDTKTAVLVAREFDRKGDWRMKWATYIPGHPDANDGWIIPGASWIPSHWMPLPEPPQEVRQ
ncbi:DUF551 domain-containing protein [Escherichia coli]|nr:DUF551 domain-containing protein [Escherichia coli]EHX41612.1 hypothetical protein ECDEC12D_3400 [Escherichia coli DEC12D]EKL9720020.1 DUF551 domain-containing protein [Escherichia coli]EKQ5167007.1 DUF551 domain-containing protein [Escherichia coli]ELE2265276.1 DUF551 domain-containing protein [Escherichia coli]